jgi:hypothetical protein
MNPADLMDAAAVREHCGRITRQGFLKRRQGGFPAPLEAPHVAVELWDRTEVEAWWRAHKLAHRGDRRYRTRKRPINR